MHRLWFVDNVKRHMPFSCRQQTTNSASRSLLAVAQFHTRPFLFYILHHLFSFYSIILLLQPYWFPVSFATSDIYRKGTSCQAYVKSGIYGCFRKIFLCMCHIERIFLFRFVLMLSNSFAWRKNIPRTSRKAPKRGK